MQKRGLLIAALAGTLSEPQLACAGQRIFSFVSQPSQEMILKVDNQRSIAGEVRTGTNKVVSLVTGTNPAPGHIKLQFQPYRDSDLSGVFTYEYRPCETPTGALYKTRYCGTGVWLSEDAPVKYSHFKPCLDNCKFFSPTEDTIDDIETILTWSAERKNYIGSLSVSVARSKRQSLITCLRNNGIVASFKNYEVLQIPAGLEYLVKEQIAHCGFG